MIVGQQQSQDLRKTLGAPTSCRQMLRADKMSVRRSCESNCVACQVRTAMKQEKVGVARAAYRAGWH